MPTCYREPAHGCCWDGVLVDYGNPPTYRGVLGNPPSRGYYRTGDVDLNNSQRIGPWGAPQVPDPDMLPTEILAVDAKTLEQK